MRGAGGGGGGGGGAGGGVGNGGGNGAGGAADDRIKGPWSPEEDVILSKLVDKFGARNWSLIARGIPGRSGKSCRLRWCNQLNPVVKRKPFTGNLLICFALLPYPAFLVCPLVFSQLGILRLSKRAHVGRERLAFVTTRHSSRRVLVQFSRAGIELARVALSASGSRSIVDAGWL